MNLTTIAQSQYYKRPADERFESVAALVDHAAQVKDHSAEQTYNAKELTATPTAKGILLQSPSGLFASPTYWAFGQLCRSIGAPGQYLRELPADLTAECLNHGLQHTPPASDLRLLLQMPIGGTASGSTDEPYILRAATTEKYSRVWDADLYRPIVENLIGRDGWQTPPTWGGKTDPGGAYAGVHDSFVIVVNGGSIVNDPSAPNGDGAMYRGVIIRNSEVGASSIWILEFWLRAICGNHLLIGAVLDRQTRRRHVGKNIDRDAVRQILTIARNFTTQSAGRDEQLINSLIRAEIASTKQGVIDELRHLGFTQDAAERAYDTTERTENASPRSYWGIAQGATRIAQETPYQDTRTELDQLAALVLARGARRVAV